MANGGHIKNQIGHTQHMMLPVMERKDKNQKSEHPIKTDDEAYSSLYCIGFNGKNSLQIKKYTFL